MKNIINSMLLVAILFSCTNCSKNTSDAGASSRTSGVGGSLARFTITNNTLYIVDDKNLQVYDVTQAATPQKTTNIPLGINIETIFPYENHLFIGAQAAMYIYNIDNPLQPTWVSTYNHVTSCDPVVVQGNYAYVTLRTDSPCRSGIDVLDVVNISDLKNPYAEQSYAMQNPKGLGVDETTLFVCDDGLKVYEVKPDSPLELLQHIPGIKAYDLIPNNKVLLVTADEGIYQYDYTNPSDLQLLSSILIQK